MCIMPLISLVVRVWALTDGKCVHVLDQATALINAIALCGHTLISASEDGLV